MASDLPRPTVTTDRAENDEHGLSSHGLLRGPHGVVRASRTAEERVLHLHPLLRRLWAHSRPLVSWFCHYPLLAFEVVLLTGIVWGWIGADYGLPNLFWHEDPTFQFVA